MTWGGSCGSSSIPLDFHSINRALKEKESRNRGHTDKVYVYQRYVYVHRMGDDVALRLYNTDIVFFHPDGTLSLYGRGWLHSNMTRLWFDNALIHNVSAIATSKWTARQYVYNRSSLFYDGIHVDDIHGTVLSEVRPPIVKQPNDKAKALRKRLTALAKVYRQFAMLHGTNTSQRFQATRRLTDAEIVAIDPATHEFDIDLYAQLLIGYTTMWHPYKYLQNNLSRIYEFVVRNSDDMLTTTQYQPKEQ